MGNTEGNQDLLENYNPFQKENTVTFNNETFMLSDSNIDIREESFKN